MTVYYDVVGGAGAARNQETVMFCFGDGTTQDVRRLPPRNINSNTTINIYRTTHTYPAPGTYTISADIFARNGGTLNIQNPLGTSFYVATTIQVNAALGLNSPPCYSTHPCPPVLSLAPLDCAALSDERFCSQSSISNNLNWNGKTTAGQDLASGLYYYQVRVRFASVSRNAPPLVQKGWIQLLRDGLRLR
ncbi:hypothetical protein GCM10023187_42560 [Nibrella viscosa]|uniref:PKD domain-containing protein n=1 Tax=Nibrella viscosa TaxID=1084524 RepID=A0ABP8KSJ6_9BACT